MKKRASVLVCASALLLPVVAAQASLTSGMLNIGSGGMMGTGGYAGSFQVSWEITNQTTHWHYAYTISGDGVGVNLAKDVSHLLLEVSTNFTHDNIWNETKTLDDTPKSYSSTGTSGSNPYLPATVFAQKFDTGSGKNFVVEFDSDRAPMWGNFYAKSGGGTAAWNTDFATPVNHALSTAAAAISALDNTTVLAYKLGVPDTLTTIVPAPAAAGLCAIGLGLAGWIRRRLA